MAPEVVVGGRVDPDAIRTPPAEDAETVAVQQHFSGFTAGQDRKHGLDHVPITGAELR